MSSRKPTLIKTWGRLLRDHGFKPEAMTLAELENAIKMAANIELNKNTSIM